MSTLQNLELASQMQPRHSCVAASPDAPLSGSWHVFGGSKISLLTYYTVLYALKSKCLYGLNVLILKSMLTQFLLVGQFYRWEDANAED